MRDELFSLWPWFFAAVGVGVATAAFIGEGPRRRRPARWLVWFAAAAMAGVVAIALGALQGRVAFVVAAGVACFVAFIAGASTVAVARGALGAHERWALGLVALALLWFGAVVEWPYGDQLSGMLPPRPMLSGPFHSKLPDEPPSAPPAGSDQTGAIPAPAAAPANDPKAILAALPTGDLDAETCQRALDAVAAAEPVLFNPAHATIHRRASGALDRAAEVIRRCPQGGVEVIGFDDGDGPAAALALRRARAAATYLRAEGVGGRKLDVRAADARATRPAQGAIGYALR
jgi:outer membrane protein OmpA-like peptidoglycan-associated protein